MYPLNTPQFLSQKNHHLQSKFENIVRINAALQKPSPIFKIRFPISKLLHWGNWIVWN